LFKDKHLIVLERRDGQTALVQSVWQKPEDTTCTPETLRLR